MKLSNKEKNRLKTKYGEWAVITGASSGIGLEIAHLLASAGIHLLLCSRDELKLNAAKNEISKSSSVEIRCIPADLSTTEGIQTLKSACEGLPIGLAVLSAGFGSAGYFIENPIETEINMLRLNCEASLVLAHYFGVQFAAQKRGGIILLSSMIAFQGAPFAAHYAATKAYVQSLAEGMAEELKEHGVDVLAAAPGPVQTGFAPRAGMKMAMSMTPSQIGAPILKALGRKTTVLPGALTKLMIYSLNTAPRWLRVKIIKPIMREMGGVKS